MSESAGSSDLEPLENIRAEKYATFLNNLEQWVDANVNRDDITKQQLIEKIKDSYRRSLQANIDYYDLMAKAMTDSGEKSAEKRCIRMAKVYRALIE